VRSSWKVGDREQRIGESRGPWPDREGRGEDLLLAAYLRRTPGGRLLVSQLLCLECSDSSSREKVRQREDWGTRINNRRRRRCPTSPKERKEGTEPPEVLVFSLQVFQSGLGRAM
jgi:hypothetical protein